MFGTLGIIISNTMLYNTIYYSYLGIIFSILNDFTDFAEFYLDKVTYPINNYKASSPVNTSHTSFLSNISNYH